MAGARVASAGLGEVLAGGIDERRSELVGRGSDLLCSCSDRPEVEEEDMRRQRSTAKVRWWGAGGAPRRRARKPLRRRSGQHGVSVSELEDKATWWGVCRHHVNGRVFYSYMTRIRRHF